MLDLNQMLTHVITPALKKIDLYSEGAAELVLLTGVQESRYKYVKQIGTGPALSFWQMEPATAQDIYMSYLMFRTSLSNRVDSLRGAGPGDKVDFEEINFQLLNNMAFAVAMCRLKYRRSKLPIPAPGDLKAQAHIWKEVYNSHLGAGTEEEFFEHCIGLRFRPISLT